MTDKNKELYNKIIKYIEENGEVKTFDENLDKNLDDHIETLKQLGLTDEEIKQQVEILKQDIKNIKEFSQTVKFQNFILDNLLNKYNIEDIYKVFEFANSSLYINMLEDIKELQEQYVKTAYEYSDMKIGDVKVN